MRFRDRRHAGRDLAAAFVRRAEESGLAEPLVLALPRGGVPVAAEIARALDAPLDVLVVRKIGAPGQPEYGIGAVVGDDPPLFDKGALADLGAAEEWFRQSVARERTEVRRREELYREGRPPPRIRGRTVILVDDGIATGATARAALRHLRGQGAAALILAVPVGSDAADALRQEADEVICLFRPEFFYAVGEWYEDFEQLTDREVIETLRAFHAEV